MLHFHNGNPHEVMRTANCKSMINELSLIWHNFPLTAQLFNEMTHLILSFLFMIHILTVRSLNFFICFFRFANYLQQNNFLSREKYFFRRGKRTFYDFQSCGKNKLFIAICHWYPLSNLLFTKGFPIQSHSRQSTSLWRRKIFLLLLMENSEFGLRTFLFRHELWLNEEKEAICTARHSVDN